MTTLDRAHALCADLQAARLKAVHKLASKDGPIHPEALVELATIDAVLTMLRQEIESRGENPGWDRTPWAN
jgi:hypothetical protein